MSSKKVNKKTTNKTTAKKTKSIMPVNKQLSAVELEKILRFDAELKVASLSVNLCESEWQIAVGQHVKSMTTLQDSSVQKRQELADLISEYSKKYGVEPRNFSFDDVTGTITSPS